MKKLALFHHDPEHADQFLERELIEVQSRHHTPGMEIFLAREGDRVELGVELGVELASE